MENIISALATIVSFVGLMLLRDWRDGKSILRKNEGAEEKTRLGGEKFAMQQRQIDKLFNHADIANKEMASIKTSMENMEDRVTRIEGNVSTISSDTAFIRGKLSAS